jgi:DNA-binding response OmpR family regulator
MPKIVIVNDDRCMRDAYKKLLATNGFDVADTGAVGTEREGASEKENPNVFLLDIRKSDGPALFEMIRSTYPKAKILLTSSYQFAEQKRMIEEADDFFDKSTGAQILVEKIKGVLRSARN